MSLETDKINEETQKYLGVARKCAKKGDVIDMEFALFLLKEIYSINEFVSSQIEEILGMGYKIGISKSLENAKKYSRRENIQKMERELYFATEYADYIGVEIEEECNHIRLISAK